ncbi:MAG: glycoside hydrolase family 65 protein [Proteobacteria bacterium]|nr:glycoside hydrolase family 65 protein [Pseudomonadota bacterium]
MPPLSSAHRPVDPPRETSARGRALPAYVSNGLIGLRVRENPLRAGMCLVSGFAGEHPERQVEAAAVAPYPLAGDLSLNGVWMSDQPERVELIDQAYDFSAGELTSRIAFEAEDARLEAEIVTFCSRTQPSLVCQEIRVRANRAVDLVWRGQIDTVHTRGRLLRRRTETPGEEEPACDGVLLWGSDGDLAACGLAMLTEGPPEAERTRQAWDDTGPLTTSYRLRLPRGRTVRFRQMASVLPSVMHAQPDAQALRLIARARELGFEVLRALNRDAWAKLWMGRIRLVGADAKWQAMADAAFYYLNASVHGASPASTSIFGLATWHDYHYYYGHVMWDVDAFAVPILSVMQPAAAHALLEFRAAHLDRARANAKLQGLPGLRFPWEASPSNGEEATPGPAAGATREDHVNLHVARAFALFADATGDQRFRRERAWPVLAGVAEWIVGRVTPRGRGRFHWLDVGGAAERKALGDNDALTNLLAVDVLRRAEALAKDLSLAAPPAWSAVAAGLRAPRRADGAIAAHDGHRLSEEQGAAPTPLMAIFPYGIALDPQTEQKTLELYLGCWSDYIGLPMMSAFYPAWAVRLGDRDLALKLMQEGYGAYLYGRFAQTLEYRLDKVSGGTAAGPFFANIAAFLTTLLFGLTGVTPGAGPPETWAARPVVLPRGWKAIECDSLMIQGRPATLRAEHGAARADLRWR